MIVVRDEYYKIATNLKTRVLENNTIITDNLFAYDGNRKEVEAVIYSKDKEDLNFNKYPCTILEMPYTVIPNDWNRLNDVKVDGLRILIVAQAQQMGRNEERYDNVIKPLLYPILEELLNALRNQKNIQSFKVVSVTEHPYWGTEQKIANDIWETLDVRLDVNFRENC
tara:strand:+ start:173 stop:676 length:504 start_codon:yes stop_codon:yes gene_type:complete